MTPSEPDRIPDDAASRPHAGYRSAWLWLGVTLIVVGLGLSGVNRMFAAGPDGWLDNTYVQSLVTAVTIGTATAGGWFVRRGTRD